MMPGDSELHREIASELARLGLRREDMPGGSLAFAPGAAESFLGRLRRLSPGCSWRDVLPDLPAHWEAGKPESWTTPYRPLGPYDYQELPTGPVVHVMWTDSSTANLDALVVAARSAGWPIFGAGLFAEPPGQSREYHGMIVMKRGTTRDQLSGFADWINERPGFTVAAVPRLGTERYTGHGSGGRLTSG